MLESQQDSSMIKEIAQIMTRMDILGTSAGILADSSQKFYDEDDNSSFEDGQSFDILLSEDE